MHVTLGGDSSDRNKSDTCNSLTKQAHLSFGDNNLGWQRRGGPHSTIEVKHRGLEIEGLFAALESCLWPASRSICLHAVCSIDLHGWAFANAKHSLQRMITTDLQELCVRDHTHAGDALLNPQPQQTKHMRAHHSELSGTSKVLHLRSQQRCICTRRTFRKFGYRLKRQDLSGAVLQTPTEDRTQKHADCNSSI